MARCYICDVSPGNESLYRISGTRPSVSYREHLHGWICSECEVAEDFLDVADEILSEEDLNAPSVPPTLPVRRVL